MKVTLCHLMLIISFYLTSESMGLALGDACLEIGAFAASDLEPLKVLPPQYSEHS